MEHVGKYTLHPTWILWDIQGDLVTWYNEPTH